MKSPGERLAVTLPWILSIKHDNVSARGTNTRHYWGGYYYPWYSTGNPAAGGSVNGRPCKTLEPPSCPEGVLVFLVLLCVLEFTACFAIGGPCSLCFQPVALR